MELNAFANVPGECRQVRRQVPALGDPRSDLPVCRPLQERVPRAEEVLLVSAVRHAELWRANRSSDCLQRCDQRLVAHRRSLRCVCRHCGCSRCGSGRRCGRSRRWHGSCSRIAVAARDERRAGDYDNRWDEESRDRFLGQREHGATSVVADCRASHLVCHIGCSSTHWSTNIVKSAFPSGSCVGILTRFRRF